MKNRFFTLLPLLMVILLDIAGIVLVMPVLTPLILQAGSQIVPIGTSLIERDVLYGLSMAIFPLFMFFSTPILGDLSDKFGRKNILLICLVGSAISYIISAFGIVFGSLSLFLIGRSIAGLAAGTQPIATAAIIDLSDPNNKTKSLAWVVFTVSLGLILGPAIGGITAEKNLVHWFSYQVPFIFAAGVSLLNAIILYFSFKETSVTNPNSSIQLTKGFSLFISAFLDRKFRLLALLYFCFILAWSLYYQTINWILVQNYHYDAGKLGLFVAFLGVVFACSTSIFPRFILRYFRNELSVFLFFIFIMAIANIGAAISQSEIAQWLWAILNASSSMICYTAGLNVFSNLVDREAQGWIMGVTSAINAMTWVIGGCLAGPLGYLNLDLSLWTAGILCFISFVLMLRYRHKGSEQVSRRCETV